MKFIKDNWLIIAIVILFGGNLLQYLNPVIKIKEVVKRDTLTVVRIDSVSLTRAKAELNYLRSVKGKVKYVTKKEVIRDTVTVDNTNYIVPNFIASLDTTINQSKLSLSYHYPQNYFSDIKFIYPNQAITIKETKEVQVKPLFDFSHGILVGGFVSQDGVIRLGIGYGFKIGLNL